MLGRFDKVNHMIHTWVAKFTQATIIYDDDNEMRFFNRILHKQFPANPLVTPKPRLLSGMPNLLGRLFWEVSRLKQEASNIQDTQKQNYKQSAASC